MIPGSERSTHDNGSWLPKNVVDKMEEAFFVTPNAVLLPAALVSGLAAWQTSVGQWTAGAAPCPEAK